MTEPLFEPDGEAFVATPHTISPWSRTLLHGGAVAALAVTLLERRADPASRSIRVACDFVRPLPLGALSVTTTVVRSGRRLELLQADVAHADTLVARCSLTRVRPKDVDLHPDVAPSFHPPPDVPDDWAVADTWEEPAFFGTGVEVRVADPARFMGSNTGWFRLARPVLDGTDPSPMVRAAATADFGNGISGLAPPWTIGFAFPNANVDVHLVREPEGEWLRLSARSIWQSSGIGQTRSELSDRTGEVGFATQSLVLT